jgi:hypothetical protein
MKLILDKSSITSEWLSEVLGESVLEFTSAASESHWAHQIQLKVTLKSGEIRQLRLKVCRGSMFGCSEVDFYTKDYVQMQNAPLVRCWDAQFEAGAGYHLLLGDLADTHANRFEAVPTLEFGLAVAEALGRLHAHHWEAQPVPGEEVWTRYFDHIRPGVRPLEEAVGIELAARFDALEKNLRERWADPRGMSLLHGDLNPGNILTPKDADAPVYFLDRQPFDWSLPYGLAAYDLAYCWALWQPIEVAQKWAMPVLRRWHEALGQPGYTWEQAQADWRLSVEHCLHIPIEWCTNPEDVTKMRWVWEPQLDRLCQNVAIECGYAH